MIGTTDDCSSSTSYPSSSAASCISSDDNTSSSNNNSDIDDEHYTTSNNERTPITPNINEPVNLGHMLISFLELYGVYFNYTKYGIRVQTPDEPERPAGFIDKEELFKNFCCGHRTINNICIVDPFNDSMWEKLVFFRITCFLLFE